MRGKKAKEIREAVYGDGSKRNTYEYRTESGPFFSMFGRTPPVTIYCVGKRAEYLKAKDAA